MIIQCDFDGTIIRNNLSVLIRERFAPEVWRTIEADYLDGRIGVEESNIKQYALIKESRERLQEFVRGHVDVRQGFTEFVADCNANGNRLVIVSSGLDFYIDVVFRQLGMFEIELYCGETAFNDKGITISYTDPNRNNVERGFKIGYLNWLKQFNDTIVYIGDGLSDFEAAIDADYVFATDYLATLLKEEHVPWSFFDNFFDIRNKLNLLEL